LHGGGAAAECGQPLADRVQPDAQQLERPGAGVLLDGRGGGRGRRGPRDHRERLPSEAERERRRGAGALRMTVVPASFDLVWLIPALPLGGFVVNLFFGKRLKAAAGALASALVAA